MISNSFRRLLVNSSNFGSSKDKNSIHGQLFDLKVEGNGDDVGHNIL